jgi:ankyrin repeat protein
METWRQHGVYRPRTMAWALAAVLALVPDFAGLHAQTAAPKTEPLRLTSNSPPEVLASVEMNLAVRKGDLARAEKALAGAPSLLADVQSRQALLVLAAQEGHPAIVRWLLQKGASPTEAFDRVAPLTAALSMTRDILLQRQENDPELWQQLEQRNQAGPTASPSSASPPNSPQARAAALAGCRRLFAPMPAELLIRKTQIVELLLTAGARPATAPSPGSGSPSLVYVATLGGFGADVINRLVQAGADPGAASEKTRETPLHLAALNGNLGAAEALLSHRVDLEALSTSLLSGRAGMQIASGGTTPLMNAIMLGQEEMVRFLLAHGAKPETTNRTLDRALHFAAASGHPAVIRQLLDRGARVNASDHWQSTPLHYAALYGQLEAAKLLLAARADLEAADEAGFTPLLNAAEHDHLDIVTLLLAKGASRRARTDAGKGPLRVAATSNALQVAEFLLGLGEKIDGEPSDSMRPLHEAASSGYPQMVALLLQHGAATEVRDRAMQGTPLHDAIYSAPTAARQRLTVGPPKSSYGMIVGKDTDYLEIVRLLAAHGADLNATDRWGNAALHLAAEYGDRGSVALLLALGARRDLTNGRNLTPGDIALLKGHQEVADLLRSASPSKS